MKAKKGYKSVLIIAVTLLVLFAINSYAEPHPWATIADPLQEQVQSDTSGHTHFAGFSTPWCCEWNSGLQN
jgi:hypothetical protein